MRGERRQQEEGRYSGSLRKQQGKLSLGDGEPNQRCRGRVGLKCPKISRKNRRNQEMLRGIKQKHMQKVQREHLGWKLKQQCLEEMVKMGVDTC